MVIAAIFIGAGFYAARNVALAVIAVAIPLARHTSLALERRQDARVGERRRIASEPPAILLALCALGIAIAGGSFSTRLKTWKPVPAAALAFMKQHQLRGNLLGQFEWGSYILWHSSDDFKVYIDPRGELVYTDKQEGDYATFYYGKEGADRLLDEFPHDFVLVGAHTKGCDLVKKNSRWHLLYSDQTAALFGRNALPGQAPVIGNVAGIDGDPADTYFP